MKAPVSSSASSGRGGHPRPWPAILLGALPAISGCWREDSSGEIPHSPVSIRVQVLNDHTGPLVVEPKGAVRLSTLPDIVLFEGTLPEKARFLPDERGFRLGEEFYPSPVRVSPLSRTPISIRPAAEDAGAGGVARAYRGVLDLMNIGGRIRVVNQVSLEEYIAGVVGAEMPSSFPQAALECQAIASRTYAAYHLRNGEKKALERGFAATDAFQVYKGASGETPAVRRAVRATAGWVLSYKGMIFPAYFHSTCGGNTTSAAWVFGEKEIPPLRGVQCDGCVHLSPTLYRWAFALPLKQVEALLKNWAEESKVQMGSLLGLQTIEPLPGGYLRYVKVIHSGGSFEVRADIFRGILRRGGITEMKSTSFEVEPGKVPETLEFRGSGFGHGVGMCQCGAAWKGRTMTYWEILAYYYPESELKKIY